jgi:hypothetical protein
MSGSRLESEGQKLLQALHTNVFGEGLDFIILRTQVSTMKPDRLQLTKPFSPVVSQQGHLSLRQFKCPWQGCGKKVQLPYGQVLTSVASEFHKPWNSIVRHWGRHYPEVRDQRATYRRQKKGAAAGAAASFAGNAPAHPSDQVSGNTWNCFDIELNALIIIISLVPVKLELQACRTRTTQLGDSGDDEFKMNNLPAASAAAAAHFSTHSVS